MCMKAFQEQLCVPAASEYMSMYVPLVGSSVSNPPLALPETPPPVGMSPGTPVSVSLVDFEEAEE